MKGTFNRWKSSWSQASRDTDQASSRDSPEEGESSSRNNTSSNFDDQGLPPVKLNGYSPSTKKRLLTSEMCDEIRSLMPTRIQLYTDWHLLYSLEQHGSSLQSLYHNVAPPSNSPLRVGYVLAIRDNKHGTFGAYSNEPFHPTSDRRYYGNGECFLWKMEKVPNVNIGEEKGAKLPPNCGREDDFRWQFRGYPFTGVNEFAIYCQSNFLSMGAGDGHYGLWCDDNLLRGVSNPSLTYGNDVLSREGKKFHIVALEVWRVG